jgi:hypothetical protein
VGGFAAATHTSVGVARQMDKLSGARDPRLKSAVFLKSVCANVRPQRVEILLDVEVEF